MKVEQAAEFLRVAKQLGGELLLDVQRQDPGLAQAIAQQIESGARVVVALVLDRRGASDSGSEIALMLLDSEGAAQRVCGIPVITPPAAH